MQDLIILNVSGARRKTIEAPLLLVYNFPGANRELHAYYQSLDHKQHKPKQKQWMVGECFRWSMTKIDRSPRSGAPKI